MRNSDRTDVGYREYRYGKEGGQVWDEDVWNMLTDVGHSGKRCGIDK